MKCKLFFTIILATILLSFINKNEIGKCYISFNSATNLTAAQPNRLPKTSYKSRTLRTDHGDVSVTRIDGYRVLYNNDKKAPFVNLKIELSEKKSHEKDQKTIIDNLRYLNAQSIGMETKDLIELNFNGYKIYGFNRSGIETGSILGTFVLFPGNNVTVYFYFNNMEIEYRNFKNIADYKVQRDRFIYEYTKNLTACQNK